MEELRPSPHHSGTYDQPEAAIAWLKAFRSLNSHFTSQVHTYTLCIAPPSLSSSLPVATSLEGLGMGEERPQLCW